MKCCKKRFCKVAAIILISVNCCTLRVNAASEKYVSQFVKKGNSTYYYDENGEMARQQFVTTDGKTYYFGKAGRMKYDTLFKYKKYEYYATSNGKLAKNTIITSPDGKKYYLDSSGKRVTGWVHKGNRYYYFPESGECCQNKWYKIGKSWFYFNDDGYMETDTWIDGYYIGEDGFRLGKKVRLTGDAPKKYKIKMSPLSQKPELPTGCEAVALTMVLNYNGFSLNKTTIAANYLPLSSQNFVTAFKGNPFEPGSAGIYSPGLTAVANNYLKDKSSSKRAYNITGASFKNLYTYIRAKIPVIVWNTMYMKAPIPGARYTLNGKEWTFYRYEHCVVLCGYNENNNTVYINDPIEGLIWRNVNSFEEIYDMLGEMAIVIQ